MPKLDVDIPYHLGLTRCSHQVTETGKERKPILESSQTLAEVNEDGILSSILSSLKMRDAVRTSILSRRWRNIWTFIPDLNFNSTNMLPKDLVSPSTFIRSVNEFLEHHQGFGVNIFNVSYKLTKKDAHHLDKWIDFAIGSGAKELVLCLYNPKARTTEPYNFPFQLFDNGKGCSIESISVSFCDFSPHATFIGFSFLKSLSLHRLYLTDMQIGTLLSCCFVIERLSIQNCKGLVNLDIYERSGRLNSLIVYDCNGLLSIKLDSIVLTFLEYKGDWPMLYLKNRARVVNATINLGRRNLVTKSFLPRLASDIPQLEGLSLNYGVPGEVGITSTSYKLTHLKKLFLYADRFRNFDALGLALILKAAPLLEEFHVNIYGWRHVIPPALENLPHMNLMPLLGCKDDFSVACVSDMTHVKLKQFELSGFDGWKDEVELVSYVMRNAIALELVTVDCTSLCHSFTYGWMKGWNAQYNSAHARIEAFQQLSQIPPPPCAKLLLRS